MNTETVVQEAWTAEEVQRLLQVQPQPPQADALENPFVRAAALLSHFSPNELHPIDELDGARRDQAFQQLIEVSTVVPAPSGTEQHWMLADEVRQRVLRSLDFKHIERGLASNQLSADTRQQFMVRLLKGESIDPNVLPLNELRAFCQVAGWLRGMPSVTVPEDAVLRARIAREELLQPFRHLVGHHFRGRRAELDTLRNYVGVLPPDAAIARLQNVAGNALRAILDLDQEPPLFIQGAGGAGKSTLLAKFVLEHTEAADEFRFPFVYLDFDRPGLMGEDPTLLLMEIAAQLDVQFPDRGLRTLYRSWNDQVIADSEAVYHIEHERIYETQVSSTYGRRVQWLLEFARAFAFDNSSGKPFVLVLDTFEEVQYRSSGYVAGLWDFLKQLQQMVPRMRVVLAGRAPMTRHPTNTLELKDFDREAALGFLTQFDISPATAEVLFQHLGGNPLTLKLGAEVVRREEGKTEGLLTVKTRGLLHARLDAARVQGLLYDRILSHVKNNEVRRLAHPGLVLRRITPELITEVLAGPCHVQISDQAHVETLFREFAREVSLVTTEPDQSIRHIPYIRKVMLPLVRSQSKAAAEAIDDNAVAYYQEQTTPAARAEELYHRLMRGENKEILDSRWDDVAGETLASALDELPPAGQAYLASRLGLEVDPEVRKAADLETWEIDAERRARQLIRVGKHKEAQAVLAERKAWRPGSRLYVLAASIHAQLGKPAEAQATVARGLESADQTTSAGTILDLTLLRARLHELEGRLEEAAHDYTEVIEQARQRRDARLIWEVGLARLGLHHMGVATPIDVQGLRELMVRTYHDTPFGEHTRYAGLLRWVAGEIAHHNPELMVVIVNDLGLGSLTQLQQQVYKRALRASQVPDRMDYFTVFVANELAQEENDAAVAATGALLRAGGLTPLPMQTLPPEGLTYNPDEIRYFADIAELRKIGRRIRGQSFDLLRAGIDHGEVLVGIYDNPEIDELAAVLESAERDQQMLAMGTSRVAVYAVWLAEVNRVLDAGEQIWRARLYAPLGAEALGAPAPVVAKKAVARKPRKAAKQAPRKKK